MDVSILSNGAIQACIDGKGPSRPIFQVLGIKKIQSDRGSGDRYRLQLSDGIHYQPGMMATQMNVKVTSDELNKFAVIQVEKMIVNAVQNRKIMILINFTIMHNGDSVGGILGSPKSLEITVCENGGSSAVKPAPAKPVVKQEQQSFPKFGDLQQRQNNVPPPQSSFKQDAQKTPPPKSFYGAQSSMRQFGSSTPPSSISSSPIASRNVFPITSLNPYQSKWTIKARVTNKPNMRTYSNSKGEGRVMSVDLLDQSGEIRATAFNDDADRLYPILQQNKVYLVSRGRLKPANKQFNPCNNEYEITFGGDTQIEECVEASSDLPTVSYNFRSLSSLEEIPKDTIVDVIGICSECPDVQTITTKANKQLTKRDITLIDKSGRSVVCTLWSSEAESFDGSNNPVVALKGVRTSEFNGVTLSSIYSTLMTVDPDISEAHSLRGWYQSYGKDQKITSLSSGSFNNSQTAFLNFKQVQEVDIGKKDKADYFNAKGCIVYLKRENFLYKACAKPDCNKKVVEDASGRYLCEKCNYQGDDFKYRMILKLNLADAFNNLWIDCFNESAETVLGLTSQELGELKDSNPQHYDNILDEVNFKEFIFKLRAKIDTYNDEQRLRCSSVSVTTLNYASEAKRRLEEIKVLMNK